MALNFNDTKNAFEHQSDKELIQAKFLFKSIENKFLLWLGKRTIPLITKIPFFRKIIKATIFKQFIGGETILECIQTSKFLFNNFKVGVILDYAVEGQNSNFDESCNQIIKSIKTSSTEESIPFAVFKFSGIGSSSLIQKKQEGIQITKSEQKDFEMIIERANKICETAKKYNTPIFIDAEESWIQKEINNITIDLIKKYNTNQTLVFTTIQFYLKDSFSQLKELHQMSISENLSIGIKLVRGAYLEKENETALQKQYSSPIFETKEETDKNYNNAIKYCVRNINKISICVATHNENSIKQLTEYMNIEKVISNDYRVFSAQLYGMSNHISFNLILLKYNVVKYLPYGPVEKVIPYLMRRADENKGIKDQNSRELELIKIEIQRRKKTK